MSEEPTFTPGPWRWRNGTFDPFALEGGNGRDIIRAVDGHVYSEYSSDPATLELSSPEDCNLIVAAPDLYAALEAMLAAFGNGGDGSPEGAAALEKARRALDKADGIKEDAAP